VLLGKFLLIKVSVHDFSPWVEIIFLTLAS
jgi:hypothetical protein